LGVRAAEWVDHDDYFGSKDGPGSVKNVINLMDGLSRQASIAIAIARRVTAV
jgi:hypothetical protein